MSVTPKTQFEHATARSSPTKPSKEEHSGGTSACSLAADAFELPIPKGLEHKLATTATTKVTWKSLKDNTKVAFYRNGNCIILIGKLYPFRVQLNKLFDALFIQVPSLEKTKFRWAAQHAPIKLPSGMVIDSGAVFPFSDYAFSQIWHLFKTNDLHDSIFEIAGALDAPAAGGERATSSYFD